MKKIDIEITSDELIKALLIKFKNPEDYELAELIVNAMIEGQRGVELLTSTLLLGYQKEFLNEGDIVLVNVNAISMYIANEEDTLKDSRCCEQGYIRACITNVTKYNSYPYKISYNIINKEGECIEQETICKEFSIVKKDQGFIDE